MAEQKCRKPTGLQQRELWQVVPPAATQTRRRASTRLTQPTPTSALHATQADLWNQPGATQTGASATDVPLPITEEAAIQQQQFLTALGQETTHEVTLSIRDDQAGQPAQIQEPDTALVQETAAAAGTESALSLEMLRPLVTVVKLWQLTLRQKEAFILATPLCILGAKDREKEVHYSAGIVVKRNEKTGKQQGIERFGERTTDLEEAYRQIEQGVNERGLTLDQLQPIEVPEPPPKKPEPARTVEELQANPLLALLQEDEIYVDPNEVTLEEAEEKGYPLLRRDVITYKWWLEFPFDTREQPEVNQALKDSHWRWGGYRQQWYNPAHFPDMPKDMYYANAGPAFYSEENAERIEARATKARSTSDAHLERSDQLASIIPFGQPMLRDHYSYKSDLSYRKKIWRQMDLFVAFYKKAEWLENRADGSRRLQGRTNRLPSMQNRVDRLSADLRKVRREYEEAKGLNATYLDYYRKRLTILAQEIIPLQSAIAERGGLPIDEVQQSERPLQPGDYILVRGRGVYVEKVNKKTIICRDPSLQYASGDMWQSKYDIQEFQRLIATKEQVEAARAKEQLTASSIQEPTPIKGDNRSQEAV